MTLDTRPQTRRCDCGAPIGPLEQWCSHSCFNADQGERDEVES